MGEAKRYKRHAYASYLLVWDAATDWAAGVEAIHRAAQVVGGHHGVIPAHNTKLDRRRGDELLDSDGAPLESLRAARARLFATIRDVTGGSLSGGTHRVTAPAISLAIVTLADWLVSQTSFLSGQSAECGRSVGDPRGWYAAAERRCRETTIPAAGIIKPAWRPVSACALIPAGYEPSPLQRSIEQHHPVSASGITFIKAPTGDGKTEAALIVAAKYAQASGHSGWYFAMPSRGTADGLFERLNRVLPHIMPVDANSGPAGLQRVHGLSNLHDVESHAGDGGREWLSGNRKALLAPFGVGTIDQALMGAMRVKHSPIRMLGIGTGCLILDEAHSYDWYTSALMKRLLAWVGALRGAAVVISATMPQALVSDLAAAYQHGTMSQRPRSGRPELPPPPRCAYPGWMNWTPEPVGAGPGTWRAHAAKPQRAGWLLSVELRNTAASSLTTAMAERANDAVRQGGCVLVVRETVSKAQRTYDAVLALADHDTEVVLLHSRFRHRDRRRIEQRIVSGLGPPGRGDARPRRLILVSTQIVETSLDVDFDFVISDPAPIGSLIQRAGRTHRHHRRERPPIHATPRIAVYWPCDTCGASGYRSAVYMAHDLRSSRALLDGRSTIAVPEDVPALVDQAAVNAAVDEDGEVAWIEWLADADVQKGHATRSMCPDPARLAFDCVADLTSPLSDDNVAPTRLGVPTVLVLPVYTTIGDDLCAAPGGPPLPATPTVQEEQQLMEECVPVPRYPQQSAWLELLDDPPTTQHGRTAWSSGPLAGVKLLRCDRVHAATDRSVELEGWRISISPTRGLDAERL